MWLRVNWPVRFARVASFPCENRFAGPQPLSAPDCCILLPMSDSSVHSLAVLVERAEAGDASAKGALFSTLYADLHRLAEAHIRNRGGNLTLGVTTLLHEAYLEIAHRDAVAFPDRNRFLGYASRAMRGLVINYVRERHARKRGGELTFTSLDEARVPAPSPDRELDALSSALEELAEMEPLLAELVDLKFFCGFSFVEIASLSVSERTVQRDWTKARLLLHRALRDND
jgi:RNA polymerase sigma factor (TIGR02999 family)